MVSQVSVKLFWVLCLNIANRIMETVHAEAGDDGIKFANDIADWIIQRASTASSAPGPSAPTVAKL